MASKNPIHRARGKAVETHEGLFRVRDNHQSGGHVWGENLSWDDANKLKEKVVGSRKSRTALVEPMNLEHAPAAEPADPYLAKAKAAAMKAATGAAAAANARHKARQPQPVKAPPPPPPPADIDDFDLTDGETSDDDAIDDSIVQDILGDLGGAPSADDVHLANKQAEEDYKKALDELRALVIKKDPLPGELVQRVAVVPDGYVKGEDGVWRFEGVTHATPGAQ